MTVLADMADWRFNYALTAEQYRWAWRAGYNRQVVETNYKRALRQSVEAFHECRARLA